LRVVLLSCLVLLAGCKGPQATTPQSIQTIAPDVEAIARDIRGFHDRQYPECKMSKVLSATLIGKAEGFTNEAWVIEGCSGKRFTYKVAIMLSTGNFFDVISNIDGSPVVVH